MPQAIPSPAPKLAFMTQAGSSNSRPRVAETSAGGFVLKDDGSNEIALIARLTRGGRLEWCIPKGHPEGSETYEQAAVREILEETGLRVEIIEPLGQISYEFSVGPKTVVKTVHHFLMRQIGGDLTVENDPDHEAEEAAWCSLDKLEKQLSHYNERKLARKVIEWVNAQ